VYVITHARYAGAASHARSAGVLLVLDRAIDVVDLAFKHLLLVICFLYLGVILNYL
jgi:hypothetical protein